MAVGDVKSDLVSVAGGGATYLTIQPPAGEEWVIHNIYAAADVKVLRYDGVDEVLLDQSSTTGKWWSNLQLHVTNGQYLRVLNLNASAQVVGYDGVQTK